MKKSNYFPDKLFSNVKHFRKGFGLSLNVLAERVNISRGNLSKIEQGLVIPSVLTALRLASYLEVNVEQLFIFEKKIELNEFEKRELERREVLIRNGIYTKEDFKDEELI